MFFIPFSFNVTFKVTEDKSVVLNGQISTWTNATVGEPQCFIFGTLLVLICTNNISEKLSSNAKLVAEDTYLF